MDMYQKRKIRAENKKNNSQESFPSVGINWYPGHMAKTKRQIIEDMKLVDVVIELLDARIPKSSQNPDIQGMLKNKKKIVILNKSDLADEKETKFSNRRRFKSRKRDKTSITSYREDNGR